MMHEMDHDKIDLEHQEGTLDRGEEPARSKDFAAMNEVNAHEKSLSYWQGIVRYRIALIFCFCVSLGAMLNGLDGSIQGQIISIPTFRRAFGHKVGEQYIVPAAWQSSWSGGQRAVTMIAAACGGWLADWIGRRNTLYIACIISIGSVFMLFYAPEHSFVVILIGRMINGSASALFSCVAAAYTSELSPLPIRGLTTGGLNCWIVLGQLTAACTTYACGSRNDDYAWRIPLAVQWSVPALMLLSLPFVPESPWYLVRKGKVEAARKALKRVYWLSGDDVDQHLARIEDVVELEAHNKAQGSGSYADLFRGSNVHRTIVVAVVFACQEFAGVQFVLGFSTYFFQLAGFPTAQSFKLNIGTLSLAFVGNLIGLSLINRVGRRRLFIVGMLTCATDCLGLAICSMIPGQAALWGQASFTMIYMLAFQSGIGPVAYALCGELGSAKLRSKTVGFGLTVHNFSVGATQVILPYLVNPDEANLKGKVGWIFFGVGVVGAVWAYFFVPETAHRNVDELDELFARRIPARKFHTTHLGTDRSAVYQRGV